MAVATRVAAATTPTAGTGDQLGGKTAGGAVRSTMETADGAIRRGPCTVVVVGGTGVLLHRRGPEDLTGKVF